ncbi:MAG: N-acetyltransferase [Burkholderiales bacterium]|nr:MAG: N-acetyltransferase [Burkholderiales bacterium]
MSERLFSTKRLDVRRWRDDDLPHLESVYGDSDAMRYVGDGAPITREECVHWLGVTARNFEKRGYGMAALVEQASKTVIGFCGLVHPGQQTEVEIKYALKRAHWGCGFATEAVAGMLEWGARVFGMSKIIATTAPENFASHRVLLKCGMKKGILREDKDGEQTQLFIWRSAAPIAESITDQKND